MNVASSRVPFDSWNKTNITYWIEKIPCEIKTEDIPIILGGVKRLDDLVTRLGISLDFKKIANKKYKDKMVKEQKTKLNNENQEWFESDFLAAHEEAVLIENRDLQKLIRKILHHQGLIVFSSYEQREFMKKGLDYTDIAQLGIRKLTELKEKKILDYMRITGEAA